MLTSRSSSVLNDLLVCIRFPRRRAVFFDNEREVPAGSWQIPTEMQIGPQRTVEAKETSMVIRQTVLLSLLACQAGQQLQTYTEM